MKEEAELEAQPAAIQLLQDDLQQCIDEGFKRYKFLMDQLLQPLQSLKDSQLYAFHSKNLGIILQAFGTSYEEINEHNSTDPVHQLIEDAKEQLEFLINKQLNDVYLRKHEMKIQEVVKKVKMFTNEAETLYDEKSEEINIQQGRDIKNYLEQQHKMWKTAAFHRFKKLLKDEKEPMDQEEFWDCELKQKLQDRFEDLSEECMEEIKENSVAEHLQSQYFPRNINIGIYISKAWFKIGIYDITGNGNPDLSKHFQQLLSVSPELYFHQNRIVTGDQAKFYRYSKDKKYFNIFELITNTKTIALHQICLSNEKHNLCDHEIIAIFLNQILSSVEQKFRVKTGRIIFTFSFTPASAVKERLQESARVAGLNDIRILSSLLTMGIAGLDILQYYLNAHRPSMTPTTSPTTNVKSIFVLDYDKKSFSMGIVELNPNGINLLNPYGSDNITECHAEDFLKYHRSSYYGFEISEAMKDYMSTIYQKAIDYVFKAQANGETFMVDACIGVSRNKSSAIESLILEILQGKISGFNTFLGPLAGAAMLATLIKSGSSDICLPTETQRIRLQEAARSNLRILVNELTEKVEETQSMFGRAIEQNHLLLAHKINLTLTDNTDILYNVSLDELFGCKETAFNVCHYQIICKYSVGAINKEDPLMEITDVEIEIQCFMDADGVYTLRFGTPSNFPVVVDVRRLDTLNCHYGCKDADNSEFAKLSKLVRIFKEK